MKPTTSSPFPLVERAKSSGIIESGNALIVAPTSTGKSYIGRSIVRSGVAHKEQGLHVYLIPYPALAEAIYHSFQKELAKESLSARLKVAAGGRSDSPFPEDADVLVCTYERFAHILRKPKVSLGRVVMDEFHLLADAIHGPLLEELLVRMKLNKQPRSLCAISAVIPNPEALAKWLDVPLLKGGSSDRSVRVKLSYKVADDVDRALTADLKNVLANDGQAIVFYDSKPSAQKFARQLRPVVGKYANRENKQALDQIVTTVVEDEEDTKELAATLPNGVAAQHTSLSRETRQHLEQAFLDRNLKVFTGTPTMAGAVNVPAAAVFVRDVFRTEFVRGLPHRIPLSTGELLNLLGHAGYTGWPEEGLGYVFAKKGALQKEDHIQLRTAIDKGRGSPIVSRLPDSFDALMRLLLSIIADRGIVTIDILGEALKQSFWYHQHPAKISFDRELQSDIMEDISSFRKVPRTMQVIDNWIVSDGVAGIVKHGSAKFNVALRITGMDCSCTKGTKAYPMEVCNHLACAIRHLLFDVSVGDEARSRAIYAAADLFRRTLDLGTKIREAVGLLRIWRMIEMVPGGFRATPVGIIAANTNLDLLLVRTVGGRVLDINKAPMPEYVLAWIVEDYFPEGAMKEKWLGALEPWIKGVEIEKIKLPDKEHGNFFRGLDQLARIATLCAEIAEHLDKYDIAQVYRTMSICIQCGVEPELAPLAAASIPELARNECRYLFSGCGIHTLEELAHADTARLAGDRVPLKLAQRWVEKAKNIVRPLD